MILSPELRELETSPAGEAEPGWAGPVHGAASAWGSRFQGWVLEILQKAARDARAAQALLRDYSLLTWVLHTLEDR